MFVYGLLKPGFRLRHVIEPFLQRAVPATVGGRLYDTGSRRHVSIARGG